MGNGNRYKPRKKPTQARSRATYEAILDAAAQVLANDGYVASTTNKIAERAGVSIGSLYEYFPSKEAVFTALIERLDWSTVDSVIENFKDMERLSPGDFLTAVLKSRIDAALLYPELESLLRAEIPASLFKDQAEKMTSEFHAGMHLFVSLNPGKVRVRNLQAAMELGTAVVESTVRTFAASRPDRLKDPEFVQEFADLMTRYILKTDNVD